MAKEISAALISSGVALLIAVGGIFQDRIRRWLMGPRLKVEFEMREPFLHVRKTVEERNNQFTSRIDATSARYVLGEGAYRLRIQVIAADAAATGGRGREFVSLPAGQGLASLNSRQRSIRDRSRKTGWQRCRRQIVRASRPETTLLPGAQENFSMITDSVVRARIGAGGHDYGNLKGTTHYNACTCILRFAGRRKGKGRRDGGTDPDVGQQNPSSAKQLTVRIGSALEGAGVC